jgi:uncharacterized membrane-anchored protein YjiN (DUF445 family)
MLAGYCVSIAVIDPGLNNPRLVRMKLIAIALLCAAAVAYAVASVLRARHPAWGYVAAFSEAAMVGAIADWFAVVALFRHPLGLPIPHTAIIPSNKDRIGENLATFICNNFLSTEQVLEKLKSFDAAGKLARWLADERHAQQLTQHLAAVVRYAVSALDDVRVREFFKTTVLEQVNRLDAATLSGQVIEVLTTDGRHQAVFDALLRRLAHVLDNEELKARVAEVIASEVKYLRFVGLDNVAGRYATTKLISGLIRLVAEMADEPDHALRLQFDEFVVDFAGRLKHDDELRERVEGIKRELLASPALATYLQGVWSEVIEWVRGDLEREDSSLRARAAEAVRMFGERLQSDEAMRGWINEQLMLQSPRLIERYREDIRQYIIARVAQWNAQEMTDELERNIGRDLQFIRINGTLVGGLVGLLIHTVTQALS